MSDSELSLDNDEPDINAELDDLDNTQTQREQIRKMQSIYKVPPLISDLNKKAYQPHAVSFGPYHHGEPHLKPMEVYKQRALLNFLRRSQVSLSTIVESMKEVAQELMGSYASLEPEWQSDTEKFVNLMIVDGCFMLSIFCSAKLSFDDDYFVDDPLFGDQETLFFVPLFKRDMLLLENQLPMRVLFVLLKFITSAQCDEGEKRNVLLLNRKIPEFYCHKPLGSEMCLHVLDLFHKTLLQMTTTRTESCSLQPKDESILIRSLTEMNEANIRFKMNESGSFSDISFDGGVLRLPKFVVDTITESIFLNLIAFERCHIGAGRDISSFICFMNFIAPNDRDIKVLSSKGIIRNLIGNDKAVVDLFNTMSKDLILESSNKLQTVIAGIDSYCKKPWHKWRAELIHTYFKNPWRTVSVVAAIVLFTLTTLQTVYAVYDIKHK